MKCSCKDICDSVCSAVREFRAGNRLMVHDEKDMTMSFYKKNSPDKCCGTMKLQGSCDYGICEAILIVSAIVLMCCLIRAISSVLRRI